MLPEDLHLKSGESHFRIDGNGVRRHDFATAKELAEWADAEPKSAARVHMVMFFARDNSGHQGTERQGAAVITDDGECVAIRATGMGRGVIDAVLEAAELRKRSVGQRDAAQPRPRRDDLD
jgi:hypothetical protein